MSLPNSYQDLERSYQNLEKAYASAMDRLVASEDRCARLERALTEANARFDRLCTLLAEHASLRAAPPVILPECPPGFTMVATPGIPRG